MATWSTRRKFIYGGSLVAVGSAIIFGIFFSLFYKAPTCNDGIKNGKEQDVDCGGTCIKLCQSAFLPARIEWGGAKFEKVADGLYNAASYVVNPNTNGAALQVPYKFSLYDNQGILIAEREGVLAIPAHRNTLAFESAISTGKRIPVKATFEFLRTPQWFKSHDTLDGLAVIEKKYNEDEKSSSLEVMLENRNLTAYKKIIVNVVLYDINGNAIGFSRTNIDEIAPNGGREMAPFTWPMSRGGRVVSVEVLPETIPVRD